MKIKEREIHRQQITDFSKDSFNFVEQIFNMLKVKYPTCWCEYSDDQHNFTFYIYEQEGVCENE